MSAPVSARPGTAEAVATALLREVGEDPGQVRRELDWSGPVELPLPDEAAVQAACGIMQVHGRSAGRPVPLGVPYASTVAGVLLAQGALAVAIARARGGRIERVRTSVAQSALLAVQQYLAVAGCAEPEPPAEPGAPPPLRTADGVRCELETLTAEHWLAFWTALGVERGPVARGWRPFQQRFGTATCALPFELHAAVRAVGYADVLDAARASGVSVLPVRADPAPPLDLPACELAPLPGIAPRPLGAPGALPLSGIVVVESTRRVQGPVAGQVLRMLGADVVRVEPPGGDPMRGVPPMAGDCSVRHLALNAGKRVVEVDIRTAAGRRELHELVEGADAFVHNWAPGKAARLGLDAARLAPPGLSYAWASGWGDALGPEPPLGTDFLVQAHSGLAAAVRPGRPPAPSLLTLTDVLGGLVCAFGVLAALLRRVRTGSGSTVDSSLLSAAGVVPRTPLRTPVLRTADGHLVVSGDHDAVFGGADPLAEPSRHWVERAARAGAVATPVCTDLRELVDDPRFGAALGRGRYVFPHPPWEFG
ncbi:CoA transferase [Saccharopolyspora sp. CA-218241]|uniref:CoA transferase n=1 Tax=Saccharopolyspora sp. CA-218241 TaxID=3240027 RepID=UPI003D99C1C6